MKYIVMLSLAFLLALISSIMTALGMANLFTAAGYFILILFIIIDLGRFLLFNFVVDEWHNLRGIKYFICIILGLLFVYSAVGIYSKLDSLVSDNTRQAMINAAVYNKANDNAQKKQNRSEDLAKIAQDEYQNALDWNKNDYSNCLARAGNNKVAENRCNNTKRQLDKKALASLQESLAKADASLDKVEETTLATSKNQSEIASVLTTICKLSQSSCDTYSALQNALTILIFLVIIGTDYLQIAIVLAVNTRRNKKVQVEEQCATVETPIVTVVKEEEKQPQVEQAVQALPVENDKDTSQEQITATKVEEKEPELPKIEQKEVIVQDPFTLVRKPKKVATKTVQKNSSDKRHSTNSLFHFHGPKPK